ncbi:MAG: DUF262 domain-containing protein [Smithella sp.]|jgi:hypothetical protein
MSYINTYPVSNQTTLRTYSEKDTIKLDPPYQRYGDIWTLEKKQLLIDSIINCYDIPKMYFHVYSIKDRKKTGIEYAVIDGRQRLETIWKFINGDFPLDKDFAYLKDDSVKLSGLTYQDIAKNYPKIRIIFDSFVLPIIGVETDDLDLIDDMFSRLNEAVPLNAAEKRNAFGGDMAAAIREVANHKLFKEKVRFGNKRHQYSEIAARYLLLVESEDIQKKIIDTKKIYLDAMTKNYKKGKKQKVNAYKNKVWIVIDKMCNVFAKKDELLMAQGIMTVYFTIFKKLIESRLQKEITRKQLLDFKKAVKDNRKIAETNMEKANYDLLEFDRMSQQGTNDASSIKERVRILEEYIYKK